MEYRVEIYYRFAKLKRNGKKTGVRLGMMVTAPDEETAEKIAKSVCVGSRWPSRVWVATVISEVELK